MKHVSVVLIIFVLLGLPGLIDLYHVGGYYLGVFLIMPYFFYRLRWEDAYQRRARRKWGKLRNRGRSALIWREGLQSFVIFLVIILFSQYVGNGRSPWEIASSLSTGQLLAVCLLLLCFSGFTGVARWYEKEKTFHHS
ncbi:hypothetical protein [Alteribacillus iranensis]|uniref:hypothetical protein n=1 Tax=Alteribacillus iranensis TaxID=930128 RepID=UPI001C434F07|nr:hypothetical protein [Alteribacillus iranensis]